MTRLICHGGPDVEWMTSPFGLTRRTSRTMGPEGTPFKMDFLFMCCCSPEHRARWEGVFAEMLDSFRVVYSPLRG